MFPANAASASEDKFCSATFSIAIYVQKKVKCPIQILACIFSYFFMIIYHVNLIYEDL
jgi:hypothetical protein